MRSVQESRMVHAAHHRGQWPEPRSRDQRHWRHWRHWFGLMQTSSHFIWLAVQTRLERAWSRFAQESSQLIRLDEDDCGWQGVHLVWIKVSWPATAYEWPVRLISQQERRVWQYGIIRLQNDTTDLCQCWVGFVVSIQCIILAKKLDNKESGRITKIDEIDERKT